MSDDLLVERDGAVATVVLNRPDSHNAITLEMYKAIPALFASLDTDESVKVIVVRGAGTKAFASGADISEFEEVRGNADSAKSYNQRVAAAEKAIENVNTPTIALIHGYCIGGGCGLALSCDLRFGDDRTRMAITPAKLGLVYSLESTKRLVDLVGPARTKWILMSGQQIGAEQAQRLGLLDELSTVDDLDKVTYDFAQLLTTRAQFSVRAAKSIVGRILSGQVEDDEKTTEIRNSSFDTEDYAEGVRAFLEKRTPRFR
ncbi:enoyl-CoA hydratase-related protein [Tenggerimyces flavus]|uniref:Enoyl-CoA hydratase-related protein n=1 Tax=Tenggerimyces flavus TaxID=1708749 RepID=A0ABV7YM37_9ACTN|nr:enoyl-CoA hydratase-related protein [Tenggerimyces flavus]MBM7787350.1 enoyl-CoA hydratase/carnithine racemase [Tenggerimyces flavus]